MSRVEFSLAVGYPIASFRKEIQSALPGGGFSRPDRLVSVSSDKYPYLPKGNQHAR